MKKGDIALIVIAVIILFLWFVPNRNGDCVLICVDGEIYRKLPLDKNSETIVKSEYGENTVVVRDGRVFVTDADCPDRLCTKSAITKSGRSIVCLPNRLSVIIEDGKNDEEIDVIV